jgi:hypothetical protein
VSFKCLAAFLAVVVTACSATPWSRIAGDAYELDSISRDAPPSGERSTCHPELMRVYRGALVRMEPALTVAPAFEARLARFESMVQYVGIKVYGRAPSRILNAGGYACRPVEHRRDRLSEHALGNALDVTGFRFPASPPERATSSSAASVGSELPSALRRGFTITVARDYPSSSSLSDAITRKHHEFFGLLNDRLRDSGVFRGMLGPPDPRHSSHLHLDMGPWAYDRL